MHVMSLGYLPEKYGLQQGYRVLYLFEEAGLARSVMRRFREGVPAVWHDYFWFGVAAEVLFDPVGGWWTAGGRSMRLV